MVETFKRCARIMALGRLRWLLLVGMAVGVSMVEAAGALLVFLLLALVAAPGGELALPVVGDVRALLPGTETADQLIWIAAGVGIFFCLRAALILLQLYTQERIAHNASARLSARLLAGYMSMPYEQHLRRNSAELIRNVYDTVRTVTIEVIVPSIRLFSNLVLAGAILLVLLGAAATASLSAALVMAPILFILLRLVHPRLKSLGRARQRLSTANLRTLRHSLDGIRDVTLLGRERFFIDEFSRQRQRLARVTYLSRVGQEVPRIAIETILVLFIAGFFIATVTVDAQPQEALAVLGLFAYAAIRLQPSLQKIAQSVTSIRFATAAIDDLHRDLEAMDHGAGAGRVSVGPLTLQEELRVSNVWFRYAGTDEDVLRGIDLTVRRGETVGFVGETGAGKSTLVDLLTGLLQPTAGAISVDGTPIHGRTRDWQQHLGVVPQTVFLIDDTLRNNIALGVPRAEINEKQVKDAVRLAQLGRLVSELPMGLDTIVGERGMRLSGGQRQRVAIARALYRRPSVLIFDEGTSALDNLTEAEFMHALAGLRGSHTILIVAHRLSTVRACDRIVMLDRGQIVGIAPYDELVVSNQAFRRLAVGV